MGDAQSDATSETRDCILEKGDALATPHEHLDIPHWHQASIPCPSINPGRQLLSHIYWAEIGLAKFWVNFKQKRSLVGLQNELQSVVIHLDFLPVGTTF